MEVCVHRVHQLIAVHVDANWTCRSMNDDDILTTLWKLSACQSPEQEAIKPRPKPPEIITLHPPAPLQCIRKNILMETRLEDLKCRTVGMFHHVSSLISTQYILEFKFVLKIVWCARDTKWEETNIWQIVFCFRSTRRWNLSANDLRLTLPPQHDIYNMRRHNQRLSVFFSITKCQPA